LVWLIACEQFVFGLQLSFAVRWPQLELTGRVVQLDRPRLRMRRVFKGM